MIVYGKEIIEVYPLSDLYETFNRHRRLQVFAYKGRNCVVCGREGVLLLKTYNKKNRQTHVDLYTDDFVLMTVDHIIPRSISHDESLNNKQTMCDPCNAKKADKMLAPEDMRKHMTHLVRKRTGSELLRFFVNNNNIFNRDIPLHKT